MNELKANQKANTHRHSHERVFFRIPPSPHESKILKEFAHRVP